MRKEVPTSRVLEQAIRAEEGRVAKVLRLVANFRRSGLTVQQVDDEIIIECPKRHVDEIIKIIKDE